MKQLPGTDITVLRLLRWIPPSQSSVSCQDTDTLPTLFSTEASEGGYEEMNEIPAYSYIKKLGEMVKDAQESGYCSIKGGFPGTTQGFRYPLQTIDYWKSMSRAITSRKGWVKSIAWLKNSSYPPLVDKYINNLPWMNPSSSQLAFLVDDLCILLSDRWFNDSHIDFFATCFNQAAAETSPPILITTLPFSRCVNSFNHSQVSIYTLKL